MSYLNQKYGIQSILAPVHLNAQEIIMEGDISNLLEIIDNHTTYWSNKRADVTNTALGVARSFVMSLLSAIHEKENRLQRVIAAIYQQKLKNLVKAMRIPRVKGDDKLAATMKQKVIEDRTVFKAKLRSIVIALRDMLKSQLDSTAFNTIMQQPRDAIQKYLDDTVLTVEEIDPSEELANEDNIEHIVEPPPSGMYA